METDISPLAKRLAEENNVNWRSLAGSGSSGRVVERDVLEYLARVMAGEEDLNPTAEPVPEGMEAWPEADVQGFTATATAPATESAEDDAMFGDEPASTMPSVSATRNDGFVDDFEEEAIDEDIFLFDDDETEPSQTEDAYTETFGAPSSSFAEADTATSEPDEGDLDDAFTSAEPVAFATDEADGDALEDDLFTLDEPETDIDEDVSLFVGEAVTSDEPAAVAEADFDEPVAGEPTYADDFAAATFATEESLETSSEPAFDSAETESFEPEDFETDSLEPEDFEPDSLATETAFADPTTDEVDTAFAESDAAEEPEPAAAVATTDTPAVTADTSLPLVSYGVLLRRRVDSGALTGAQVAIGQELGGEPVSPTSLLLRAAARAAHDQFGTPGVGLATLGNHVSVSAIEDAATMTFRDLVTRIDEERATLDKDAEQQDEVGLAVADLSHLNIDEAVLNLGVPVLTLGRVLKDDAGTYSTLTLSGEVEVETGTQVLAAVAELLTCTYPLGDVASGPGKSSHSNPYAIANIPPESTTTAPKTHRSAVGFAFRYAATPPATPPSTRSRLRVSFLLVFGRRALRWS